MNKKHCAFCGEEITGCYLMVGDNYLQVKYFDDPDGNDNVFCSETCVCNALSVISVSPDDDEDFQEVQEEL